jgi:flavin-binding protein dodecin
LVERDRFAATRLIGDVLAVQAGVIGSGELPIPNVYQSIAKHLAEEPAILTLIGLRESLEQALAPPPTLDDGIVVTLSKFQAEFKAGPLRSDNGVYYVERKRKDAIQDMFNVIGPGALLRLIVNTEDESVKLIRLEKLTHDLFQRKVNRGVRFEGRITLQAGAGDDAQTLVAALLDIPAFAGDDEPQSDAIWQAADVDAEEHKQRSATTTSAIWKHLIEAEFDSQPDFVVAGPRRPHPTRQDMVLIPFKSETTIEYAPDEKVEVLKELDGGEFKIVALLEHRYSTPDELAIVPRTFSEKFALDSRYVLRSKAERSSYERRYEAVDRILSGQSVIANLVGYFERTATSEQVLRYPEPTDADLDEYDVVKDGKLIFSLNRDQKAAFKRIASSGPVSLLQGPPGTGKTSFIGAFLDYIIHKQGARSILLVSQSHEATNNALEGALRLAERRNMSIDVVRVGEDGSLSDAVRHVGVAALQESYRERFRSEFKKRIVSLSSQLRLNPEFVDAFAQTMIHMDRLAQDVSMLERDHAAGVKKIDGADLGQRLYARKQQLELHALKLLTPEQVAASKDLVGAVKDALALKHGVRNPSAVTSLHQLLKISQEWVDVLGAQSGNFAEFLAKTRTIVAGTCVGVGRWNLGVSRNSYDWVVIDEAARATPSELAVSMQVGKRILLVGDHFQLPPLYKDELRKEMAVRLRVGRDSDIFDSDFERAFESPYGEEVGATLTTQYRMASEISSLVSQCFYEPRGKRLEQGRGKPEKYFEKLNSPFNCEVSWVDTSNAGKSSHHKKINNRSCNNQYEARVIVDVLRNILGDEVFTKELVKDLKTNETPIGIIAMYAAQVTLINNAIARAEWLGSMRSLIKVDTVDSYQGKENRIIILSLVRNNDKYQQGFLSSPNRLNVAMSRAMDRLIVVGAMRMWKERNVESPLGKFVELFEKARSKERVGYVIAEALKS